MKAGDNVICIKHEDPKLLGTYPTDGFKKIAVGQETIVTQVGGFNFGNGRIPTVSVKGDWGGWTPEAFFKLKEENYEIF